MRKTFLKDWVQCRELHLMLFKDGHIMSHCTRSFATCHVAILPSRTRICSLLLYVCVSLWLLLFREQGSPDTVTFLGIAFCWPGNFGFLLLGSQLSYKTTVPWEDHADAWSSPGEWKVIGWGVWGMLGREGEATPQTCYVKASDTYVKKPCWIFSAVKSAGSSPSCYLAIIT